MDEQDPFAPGLRHHARRDAAGTNGFATKPLRLVGAASALDVLRSTFDNQLIRLASSQSFFDDRWIVSVGKPNPNDFVADNIFANDETRQFLAQPFDGNSTWPVTFQDKCEGVGTIAIPTDWLFMTGYAVSAAGVNDAWLDLDLGDGYAVAQGAQGPHPASMKPRSAASTTPSELRSDDPGRPHCDRSTPRSGPLIDPS